MQTSDPRNSHPAIRIVSGIAVALVVVAFTFVMAKATGDDLVTRPEFGSAESGPLTLPIALGATTVGGFTGVALALAARRLALRPRDTFFAVCGVALIGYGILAFMRAETVTTAVWLNVMHIGAAVPILAGLASLFDDSRAVTQSTPGSA